MVYDPLGGLMTTTSYVEIMFLYFDDNKNQLNDLFVLTMISTVTIYNRPFEHLQLIHVRWFGECVERVTSLVKTIKFWRWKLPNTYVW